MNIQSKIVSGYQLPVTCASATENSLPAGKAGQLVTIYAIALVVTCLLPLPGAAQNSFPPATINLNYPQYQNLKLDGGYQYISDAGIQGVILYRVNETTYIAFERKCSINDDAPVTVDSSGLFMKGCNATYSFSDGYPTSGQTTQPLLKYRTSLTGQTLVITDEVAY